MLKPKLVYDRMGASVKMSRINGRPVALYIAVRRATQAQARWVELGGRGNCGGVFRMRTTDSGRGPALLVPFRCDLIPPCTCVQLAQPHPHAHAH